MGVDRLSDCHPASGYAKRSDFHVLMLLMLRSGVTGSLTRDCWGKRSSREKYVWHMAVNEITGEKC